MKKILILIISVLAFAKHGQTNDPALQEALQGHYKKAFNMFEKRCNNNDGYACGMVAYFYDKGFGVKNDKKRAIDFYKKGCNLNDKDSCTILGYYYYKGMIVNKNLKKSIQLLKKACNLKSKDACNYLKEIANIK